MKIRYLTRKAGRAIVHTWPPQWASSYDQGEILATGEKGVLKDVTRIVGLDRLSLTMSWSGRDHVGSLEWTPPPTLDAVEAALRAHIGEPIESIGDVEV